MRSFRLALLLLCAAACAAEDVASRLDKKEAELEALNATYWSTQYEIDKGNDKLSNTGTQKKIREVMTEARFLRDLKAARFTDPVRERRRLLFLRDAAESNISNDPELAKLVEQLTTAEAAMRYKVGDKEMKRSELNNILGHEPDRELRRQAWEAMAQITAKNGEGIRRAMRMRNQLAQQHAHRPFADFMLDFRGISGRRQLFAWFGDIIRSTEPEYQCLLARMRQELKVEKLAPWDLEYYFSTLTGDFEEKAFVPENAWARDKQVAARLGYDFNKLPVDVLITEITFGGGTYPIRYGKEARILVNRYQGLRFTDTLFHESGHGLHYSFVREPLCEGCPATEASHSFLLESDMAQPFDEGAGQIMANTIYRDEIAGEVFGLTPQQTRALQERCRLQLLFDLRGDIADSVFEFEAYADPGQDLGALYNRIYSKYLGVELPENAPSPWAYDPFYSSGPIYIQSYVLAEMVARQAHHAADARFGKTWSAETGRWLRENFFSRGGRLTLDQIMQAGTGEPLTPRYMIEALK